MAVFLFLSAAQNARADDANEYPDMEHCTENTDTPAADIVSSCTNFINQRTIEGWHMQYIPPALYFMAEALQREGKTSEAEKALIRSVKMQPDYFDAWRLLVVLSMNVPDADADMKAADVMIAANPQNPGVLNTACWQRAVDGQQLDAAMADCNESLRLSPKDAGTLDSRGFVNFRLKNYAAAIADYSAALAIDPKQASSLYMRGVAKAMSGDAGGGKVDISAANAIDPKLAGAFEVLGVKAP